MDYAGGEKLKLYDQDKALRCLYILLVSGKANIDARDADGNSALQLAVKHGHNSIYLKLILDRLGPIDHLNNQGEDALFIAIDSQQWTTYCQLMVKDYQQSSVLPSIATLKERLSAKAMEALVKAIPSAGNTLRTGMCDMIYLGMTTRAFYFLNGCIDGVGGEVCLLCPWCANLTQLLTFVRWYQKSK